MRGVIRRSQISYERTNGTKGGKILLPLVVVKSRQYKMSNRHRAMVVQFFSILLCLNPYDNERLSLWYSSVRCFAAPWDSNDNEPCRERPTIANSIRLSLLPRFYFEFLNTCTLNLPSFGRHPHHS
jgi:hypothetical protein